LLIKPFPEYPNVLRNMALKINLFIVFFNPQFFSGSVPYFAQEINLSRGVSFRNCIHPNVLVQSH